MRLEFEPWVSQLRDQQTNQSKSHLCQSKYFALIRRRPPPQTIELAFVCSITVSSFALLITTILSKRCANSRASPDTSSKKTPDKHFHKQRNLSCAQNTASVESSRRTDSLSSWILLSLQVVNGVRLHQADLDFLGFCWRGHGS